MADPIPQTTIDAADLEAVQLVRSAAAVALERGLIHPALSQRVSDAVARVTALIQREAAHG